jgi:iron complex outermembrane receptor protein
MAFTSPAIAQDVGRSGTASAGEAIDDAGIQDIIVTAQRREENLQRAAMPVSAVTGQSLINAGVSEVTGLSRLVPSLVVQPVVGASVNFYLRGVGSFAANAFQENPIAFNYNGVYIARPAAPLGTFYDLERLEVLKGPQGTLYGRNATGGAINVIPKAPSLSGPAADMVFEYGNYDSKKVSAAVNIVLGSTVALRVAGQVVDRDGYLSDGYDDANGQAIRASLLFKPNDWLTATLSADYFHQGGKGTGSVLVPGAVTPGAPDPKDRIGGSDPRSVAALAVIPLVASGGVLPPKRDGFVDGKFWGVSANIAMDLGPLTLTIVPAYRDHRPNLLAYNSGYSLRVDEASKQKSLEVRLSSNQSETLNYVIGAYYFHESQFDFFNPVHGPFSSSLIISDLTSKSAAIFGQATYSLTDSFRVVAGGRYTEDKKSQATSLSQRSFGVGPNTFVTGDVKFTKFTYKAGIEFDAAPQSLIYANISTGYKSGGFFIAATNNTFKPESLTAYTIGAKNRFFDNRLQINLEGFYWDYKDQQVNHLGPVQTSLNPPVFGITQITENAGKSRIYGFESEITFKPSKNDNISIDLQYLNAKYKRFTYTASSPNGVPPRLACPITLATNAPVTPPARAFVVDCSGNQQINAPRWSLNLSYDHEFELSGKLSLTPGVSARVESGRFMSTEYLPEEYQKGYHLVDAYLTLADVGSVWELTAFINNIENKTIYASSGIKPFTNAVYNILRAPRTYGLRAGLHF